MKHKGFITLMLLGMPIFAMPSMSAELGVAETVQQAKKGTIVDNDGNPIIGATIRVKGTQRGVVSDTDGRFSIQAHQGETLEISYIGYTTKEILIGRNNNYNIVLEEESSELKDVVVIGYGTAKKSDISGSVAVVDMKEMMKRNPTNIMSGLQGAAPGVVVTRTGGDPSGSVSVRIRGIATINGSAEPLYIVDGVQVGTSVDFLNPADVESIEVLKDASATAIYGAQGANGVVMITTKRGSKGKTDINISANMGILSLRGKLDVGDGNDYAYLVRSARANDGTNMTNKAYGEEYAGKLSTADWQDAMTRTAITQNYTISASGGTDKTHSRLSLGYTNNQGIVIESNYQRMTLNASVTQKVKDFIEMGGDINFFRTESRGSGNLKYWASLPATLDYVDATTGQFISQPDYHQRADGSWPVFMQITYNDGDSDKNLDSPYAAARTADRTPVRINQILASAYLDFKFFKGLHFKTIGSYRYSGSTWSNFAKSYQDRVPASVGENNFSIGNSSSYNFRMENYFTYNYKNALHNLTLMAGNSFSNTRGQNVSGYGRNFMSDDFRQLGLAAKTSENTVSGGYDLSERYLSFFGRLMYSFNDRYILTATIRRDGSSHFGKDNRWGTFPSVAVAWRLSEEDFIKNLNVFSNLKLRLGYGETGNAGGNTNKGVVQLTTNHIGFNWGHELDGSTNVSQSTSVNGIAHIYATDTNLKWETNKQTNIGIDMGFLNNDLNVSLDYFIRKTSDLLVNRAIRLSATVSSSIYTNFGDIENKGLEFAVDYKHRFGDWVLGANFNGSIIHNKVTKLSEDVIMTSSDNGQFDSWNQHAIAREGEAIGSFYGYQVEGIFRSQAELDACNQKAKEAGFDAYQNTTTAVGDYKYVDVNGDGHITAEDRKILGNGFPDLSYNIGLNAAYKNIDIMVTTYGVIGQDIYSQSAMKLTHAKNSPCGINNCLKEYIYGAWSANNVDAKYPRATYADPNDNRKASSAYVKNGDYFKIANLQIGYTFPRKMIAPLKLDMLRVYFSADNIACFSPYNKFGDPEIGNSNVMFNGYDGGRYPSPRQFTLGLNMQF